MKNKDGIELRIGQVWDCGLKYRTEALGKGDRMAVTWLEDDDLAIIGGDDIECDRLLSCPVLGDMSKHLIVTDEQRKLYKKPERVEYFLDESGVWTNRCRGTTYWHAGVYRVPEDYVWEPVEVEGKEIEPLEHGPLPVRLKINELITIVNALSKQISGGK